jgi:hypothetical protein
METLDALLAWSFVGDARDIASSPGLWSSLLEIEAMSKLEENWDGYGASPISESALHYGTSFLTAGSVELPAPDVVPNSNGTISLGWESPHGAAHLEIGATSFLLSINTLREPTYIGGSSSEIGRTLSEVILRSLYPMPSKTATQVQFAANFRRAA